MIYPCKILVTYTSLMLKHVSIKSTVLGHSNSTLSNVHAKLENTYLHRFMRSEKERWKPSYAISLLDLYICISEGEMNVVGPVTHYIKCNVKYNCRFTLTCSQSQYILIWYPVIKQHKILISTFFWTKLKVCPTG